jgi:hypothetical protein
MTQKAGVWYPSQVFDMRKLIFLKLAAFCHYIYYLSKMIDHASSDSKPEMEFEQSDDKEHLIESYNSKNGTNVFYEMHTTNSISTRHKHNMQVHWYHVKAASWRRYISQTLS